MRHLVIVGKTKPNKPKVKIGKINVTSLRTMNYEQRTMNDEKNKPKQTQSYDPAQDGTNPKRIYPQGSAVPYGSASWNPQTGDLFQKPSSLIASRFTSCFNTQYDGQIRYTGKHYDGIN